MHSEEVGSPFCCHTVTAVGLLVNYQHEQYERRSRLDLLNVTPGTIHPLLFFCTLTAL